MKGITRAFKNEKIKKRFQKLYQKKHHGWNEEKRRKKAKEFFTLAVYKFEDKFYNRNEAIFFKLIYNTECNDDLMEKYGIEPNDFNKDVLDNLFGNKLNSDILEQFFNHEVIQKLWWDTDNNGKGGFMNSSTVKNILKN